MFAKFNDNETTKMFNLQGAFLVKDSCPFSHAFLCFFFHDECEHDFYGQN
jgi:hypothetical protein